MTSRVITLIDMDCFYVQVEQRLDQSLRDQPCAVVQYKKWKGGGIIAVNYEARACGVKRNTFGDDAKRLCPALKLARVPEVRGKADLTRYRDASKDVFDVLAQFCDNVEKASIDEAYLDLTDLVQQRLKMYTNENITSDLLPSTRIVGLDNFNNNGVDAATHQTQAVDKWLSSIQSENATCDLHLAVGGIIVEEIRAAVFQQTTFRCSAGISHNKTLSKVACGFHKPNKQTILPMSAIPELYKTLSLKKIRNLGGKLGDSLLSDLSCDTMGDLAKKSLRELQSHYGEKTGAWLFDLGQGLEYEAVVPRQIVKSIGCSKNFRGKMALSTCEKVKYWLQQLADEMEERLKQDIIANKRTAKNINVSVRLAGDSEYSSASRSFPLTIYDAKKISQDAYVVLQKLNTAPPTTDHWEPPIVCLSLSAGKFSENVSGNYGKIETFFKKAETSMSEANVSHVTSDGRKIPSADVVGSPAACQRKKLAPKFSIANYFRAKESCEQEIADTGSSRNMEVEEDEYELEEEEGSRGKGFFASKAAEPVAAAASAIALTAPKEEFAASANLLSDTDIYDMETDVDQDDSTLSARDERHQSDNAETTIAPSSTTNEDSPVPLRLGLTKYFATNRKTFIDGNEHFPSVNEDSQNCDKCGQRISAFEMPEHLDYHVAKELQREFNSVERQSNPLFPKTNNVNKKPAKRRKVGSGKTTDKTLRNIQTFFTSSKTESN